MLTFFTILHVVLCVIMIFIILLQPGKDAGMGAALGGGAATSAFGGRGAVTFLSKATAALAAFFFISSLGLSFVGLRTSVVMGDEDEAAQAAPAAGATTPPSEGGSSGVVVEQTPGAAPAGTESSPSGAPAPAPTEAQPAAPSGTQQQ